VSRPELSRKASDIQHPAGSLVGDRYLAEEKNLCILFFQEEIK